MKYITIKRDNGSLVDIPERDLQATLKVHPKWKVVEDIKVDVAIEETPQIYCPVCLREFKNQNGLRLHKKVHE